MFEFLKAKVELIDYRGNQIVFASKSLYALHKTHTLRVQLQAHKPAHTLEVRVVSSRQARNGYIYVGRVRGQVDAPSVSGRDLRVSKRTLGKLSLRGENVRGTTLDLSSHGFRAEVQGSLEVGQQLELEVDGERAHLLTSGGSGVTVRAEVRWVKYEAGIGGLAGFRVLECMPLRSPVVEPEMTQASTSSQTPEVSDLRVVKVGASLRGFRWDGQDSTLLLEFKNASGATRSVRFPRCTSLEINPACSGTVVATLVECQSSQGSDVVTVDDLTRCHYQLRDERGQVLMSLASQPLQAQKVLPQQPRKVIAFRRIRSAAGF